MRPIKILLILFLLTAQMHAQEPASFSCEDETDYAIQAAITLPSIGDTAIQVIASVLGDTPFQPVLQISSAETSYCAVSGAYYDLVLPDGTYTPEAASVQDTAVIPGTNTLYVGDGSNQPGSFVILLESGFDPGSSGDHQYQIAVSAEIEAAGMPLRAYLFALTPDSPLPAFEMSGADAAIGSAPLEGVALTSAFGQSEQAAFAEIMPQAGTVTINIPRREGLLYALVLTITSGSRPVGDGEALAQFADDGSITLTCDGETIYENGVRINLPDDDLSYTVTVLPVGDFDPVLALVDETGQGVCYDNQSDAVTAALQLPSIAVNGSPYAARGQTSTARTIITGGRDSAAGSYALLIEGGSIPEASEAVFSIATSAGMISAYDYLTVYAVAAVDELDPALVVLDNQGAALSTAEGITMFCDNAGQPDSCPEDTVSLHGSFLPQAAGRSLPGLELDAMLAVPVEAAMLDFALPIRVSASAGSGAFVLVLHIVTD